MPSNYQSRGLRCGQEWVAPGNEKLEQAMVAGLMLQVVLETPGLPDDPRSRRRFVKSRLKDSLLTHLPGRITLDRFRNLVQRLEQWFPLSYGVMPRPDPAMEVKSSCQADIGPSPAAKEGLVRSEALRQWLARAGRELLPRRPQRKIQPERLEEILLRSQGSWFRVKDMARSFDIDRKTAWEYLQKFREAGLLVHNRGRSAAVRYRLADRFLKVQVSALEQQVGRALAGWPDQQKQQITERLAATAGEPFWEQSWLPRLGADRRDEIIGLLKAAAILEPVYQQGGQRLFRLQRQWLRSQGD